MVDKSLEAAMDEIKKNERQEVDKVSKAAVKPDLRKLPSTRKGKKNLSTWVSPEAYQQVRIGVAMQGGNIEDFLRFCLNLGLDHYKLPPIA